jgi:diguanylate cyclase (GGDEF)-like protein
MAERLRLDPAHPSDRARLDDLADSLALQDPDRLVYVLDATGVVVATSNRERPGSLLGQGFSVRPYFREAMAGRHGRFIGVGIATGVPGYYGSEPIRDGTGRTVGVAVAKHALGPGQLGPHSAERAYLVSPHGRILVSSEDGRRGAPLWPPGDSLEAPVGDPASPAASDPPLLERKVDGPQWAMVGGARFLALRHALPGTDWSLVVLKRETTKVANRLLGIAITLLVGLVLLASYVALQRQFGTESTLVFEKTEAEDRARVLARQADTDALTGVMNRLGFNAMISREVAHARRYRQPLSLLILDLDHFKRVNDEHGHPAGDQVLVSTARLLESHLRESDTLARWGGEEFVIVAPMTAAEGGVQLGEKLRALMASTPIGPRGPVTASVGVAELQAGESIESLLQRADAALYRAKAEGRNRVERAGAQERAAHRVQEIEAGTEARVEAPAPSSYPATGFAPMDDEQRDVERRVATLLA